MMPLCTIATLRAPSVWGWALTSFTSPWVAQRVCPIPDSPSIPAGRMARRSLILPLRLCISKELSRLTQMPAES